MNNKGFAITTILYGTLILFLMLLLSMLGILSTYKDRLEILIESNNGARDIINNGVIDIDSENILNYDRIHFIGNGDAFSTFINNLDENETDVGAGPSPSETIVLESNGEFALIDTGLSNSNSLNPDRARYVIDYLKSIGVEKLNFILVTHVHYDHLGGAVYILKNIPVDKFYMKVYYANDNSDESSKTNNIERYNNAYNKAYNMGIFEKINATYEGEKMILGDMEINLFATKNMQYYDECAGEDENINSILTYIVVNNKKIFLTGDIEPTSQTCLKKFNSTCSGTSILECVIKTNNIEKIDLLKLPHHGYSSCDINENILNILNTKYIVITNWSAKVNYYYKGLTNDAGISYGPFYSGTNGSCRAQYFASTHPATGSNKTAYYVNNDNVVFDFTDGNINIYNN